MTRKTQEALDRVLDCLREELARSEGPRPLFESIDWEAMDKLSDAELARAMLALSEKLPAEREP